MHRKGNARMQMHLKKRSLQSINVMRFVFIHRKCYKIATKNFRIQRKKIAVDITRGIVQ